jgi:phospholipid transport system substrate-binding protein
VKKITLFLLVGLVGLWTTVALADKNEAEKLVRDNAQKVLQILSDNKAKIKDDPQFLYKLVNDVIVPNVDFTAMSKLVLAKYWRTASDGQRKRFVDEFKGMLVRTYTNSLSEYAGNTEILYLKSVDRKEGKYVTVYTEIVQSGKPNIPVDYSLHRTDAGYKIYDVVIEGLSLVKNYRTSFAKQITDTSLDALIEDMSQKNALGQVANARPNSS